MAVVNPPGFLQNAGATHTAEVERNSITCGGAGRLTTSSLKGRGGVIFELGGALKVQQAGSPNMSVDVLAGAAYVPGSEGSKQGMYHCFNDATLNKTIAAADGTNPRIDRVSFRVRDTAYSGANNDSDIIVTTGTPAGSPSAPAAPANSITLATILIPALDTAITDSQITDLRPFYAGNGGVIRCISTARPASTEVAEGQVVYETDTDLFRYWDGASFLLLRPYTKQVVLGSNQASISFTNIPSTLKTLTIDWMLRSSQAAIAQQAQLQVNGDTGTNYNYNYQQIVNATATGPFASSGQTQFHVGVMGGASAAANNFGAGRIVIPGWNKSPNLNVTAQNHFWESAANSWHHWMGGLHFVAGTNSSILMKADLGNLVTGSTVIITGEE